MNDQVIHPAIWARTDAVGDDSYEVSSTPFASDVACSGHQGGSAQRPTITLGDATERPEANHIRQDTLRPVLRINNAVT